MSVSYPASREMANTRLDIQKDRWLESNSNSDIEMETASVNIMESSVMRRVLTEATIENLEDLWAVERGLMPAEQARRLVIPDALVNTRATLLTLPTRLIQQLGLKRTATKRITNLKGKDEADLYEAVRLTIQGRFCTMDVLEAPDDVPVLIGQLPLEHLDLVVDLRNRCLIGNPAHGGEHMYEVY
jgi:predicted aspartyl protease